MQDGPETSPKKRLGRRIALVIILSCMVITLLFLIAAPFLPRLLREKTPQSGWRATGHQVIVGQAENDPVHPICTQSAQHS